MKKILTFITLLLISNPVFAAADCGLVSEITRPEQVCQNIYLNIFKKISKLVKN